MTLLFVNACMRGEESNTLALCREYLAARPDAEVEEVNLAELNLKPFDGDMVAYRTEKQEAQAWDDPIFDLAKQIAAADEVLIGAPYWDLSFPAALKTYIEHCSVCELTFHYTEDARCEGLCKATKTTYITTSGGIIGDRNYGYDYVCGIAQMFDLGEMHFVSAEGLDIFGADVESILAKAREDIKQLD